VRRKVLKARREEEEGRVHWGDAAAAVAVSGGLARSPNLNAFAERFVLSIKSERLERMVPLGEEYLRRAILEYMAHYHGERDHQGLGNALINGAGEDSVGAGPVVRRDRIGGLLHFYHRRAGASGRTE
jgi:transposase InsO family protein